MKKSGVRKAESEKGRLALRVPADCGEDGEEFAGFFKEQASPFAIPEVLTGTNLQPVVRL
jgi:hypothetical protein